MRQIFCDYCGTRIMEGHGRLTLTSVAQSAAAVADDVCLQCAGDFLHYVAQRKRDRLK